MSAKDIFRGTRDIFTVYDAAVQVRGIIVGGVPSDPSVIRRWLESRLGAGDTRLQEIWEETQRAMKGAEGSLGEVSMEDKLDALMEADVVSLNGFKRRPESGELCYEGRCMKAALKESANSAYPGTSYDGKKQASENGSAAPRKGLLSTMAERVFVDPSMIGLGTKMPSRTEERIKHVMSPQGPVSAIARVEVVEQPLLEFTVSVRDDFLPDEAWSRIWQSAEEIGIGADRAMSDGRFDLVRWDRRKLRNPVLLAGVSAQTP